MSIWRSLQPPEAGNDLSAPLIDEDQTTPTEDPRQHWSSSPANAGVLGARTPNPPSSPGDINGGDELRPVVRRQRTTNKPSLRDVRPRRNITWLCMDEKGKRTWQQTDKRGLIHKYDLGVPIRDMRLLDTTLLTSEGANILVRDNAIVFSAEQVRLIITATMVIIPMSGHEGNTAHARFVEKLQDAIVEADKEEMMAQQMEASEAEGYHALQALPFELVALEVALGEVTTGHMQAVKELEALVMPSLDSLLKRVSKTGLELVRKLKARQQRLTIRVQDLRDELERFLDDDADLQKFCLTRKKELATMWRYERQRSLAPIGEGPMPSGNQGAFSSSLPRMRSALYMGGGSPPQSQGPPDSPRAATRVTSLGQTPLGGGGGGFASGEDMDADSTEAVENLLESYYAYVDNAYDKLVSLDEYIKDSEEFIDIDLDWNRNRLIKLEILLTAATFAIAPFNLVGGILGENVVIPWFMAREDIGSKPFWWINISAFVFCVGLFFGIVGYIKYKKLL